MLVSPGLTHQSVALCWMRQKPCPVLVFLERISPSQSNVGQSLRGSLYGSSADFKDEEEDVNNVNVEGQSSVDVFFWADGQLPVPDEELSVVH